MHLADFPRHQTIFLDANCLIYHFTGTYLSCAILLERGQRREIDIITSAVVLTETHHRLMVLETVKRFGRPLRNVPSFLKTHPELIRSLRDCEEALNWLRRFRLHVLPVTQRIVRQGRDISHEFGLLTNDAILIATMRTARITHLATNDTDFLRVPGITVWRP